MNLTYNVIATGSSGNAVLVRENNNKGILFDCGVSYKKIEPYIDDVDLIVITHRHKDHIKDSTLNRIKKLYPNISIIAPEESEITYDKIDGFVPHNVWKLIKGKYQMMFIPTPHSVPNCAIIVKFENGSTCMYATDTASIDHIKAPNLDIYFIEHNYSDVRDIAELSNHAIINVTTHLSNEDAYSWYLRNKGEHSVLVPLHEHKDIN